MKCWDPGFKFQWSVPHMGYSMLLKTNPQLGKRCVCLAVLHDNSGKSMITPIYLNSGSGCRIEGGTCAWGWSAGCDLQTALGLVLDLPKCSLHLLIPSRYISLTQNRIKYNRRMLLGTGCATQTVMATPLQGYNGIASTCASQRLMWQGGFRGKVMLIEGNGLYHKGASTRI